LGIEDRVEFLGHVPNARNLMKQWKALVLASQSEGSGLVLLEGLASGCNVVSTACRYGPREILADGRFGTLVEVGDEVGLANGMIRSLTSEPSWEVDLMQHLSLAVDNSVTIYARTLAQLVDCEREET
jgi:glycosyltransferase involved in cell wall biosynthesis